MTKENETKILAIIPARGGSKSIPKKNMQDVAGKPLLWYTFQAVQNSNLVNRTIFSSDDEDMIEYAKSNNIEVPFIRPSSLSTDIASTYDVIKHTLDFLIKESGYIPDYIILLQPTSPLRTAKHIDEAIKKLIKLKGDSLVSVTELPHNHHPSKLMKLEKDKKDRLKPLAGKENLIRRQDMEHLYVRNGAAIYIFTYDLFVREKRLIGDDCIAYFMNAAESVDIDDFEDLKLADLIIKDRE